MFIQGDPLSTSKWYSHWSKAVSRSGIPLTLWTGTGSRYTQSGNRGLVQDHQERRIY